LLGKNDEYQNINKPTKYMNKRSEAVFYKSPYNNYKKFLNSDAIKDKDSLPTV